MFKWMMLGMTVSVLGLSLLVSAGGMVEEPPVVVDRINYSEMQESALNAMEEGMNRQVAAKREADRLAAIEAAPKLVNTGAVAEQNSVSCDVLTCVILPVQFVLILSGLAWWWFGYMPSLRESR